MSERPAVYKVGNVIMVTFSSRPLSTSSPPPPYCLPSPPDNAPTPSASAMSKSKPDSSAVD
ncbi:hypothetical protein FQZ97_991740 [compost metagenome]